MNNTRLVLTDSAGIQEETVALGMSCLTVRENNERPITITEGTNTLVGTDPKVILRHINKHLYNGDMVHKDFPKPLYRDGHMAKRIVDKMLNSDK